VIGDGAINHFVLATECRKDQLDYRPGKGIKYENEVIRRKAGKTAAK